MRDDDPAVLAAAAAKLRSERSWLVLGEGLNLTYSFMLYPPAYGLVLGSTDFQAPSEAAQATVRKALATWAAVARITFTEVADDGAGGDLRIGLADIPGFAGYAFYPGPDFGGDIILDYATGVSMRVAVHEIGHALGLKHPHDPPVLAGPMDSTDYTAMSYEEDGTAETPMLLDILAIQSLYGANPSWRAGDDTYAFPEDGAQAGMPSDYNVTVYDTGGRNVFDFSATARPLIDLRAGHFSAVAQPVGERPWRYQVAIAPGTVIQGAIGGSAGSTIIGNDAGNTLTGGAGPDTFRPGAGADRIDGKGGQDTAVFPFARAEATVARAGANVLLRRAGTTDRLEAIERLSFADGDVETAALAPPPATVLESVGATALLEIAGWYAVGNGGDPAAWVLFNGAPVTVGQFAGTVPIGAEAVAGGWRVAWSVTGQDRYVVWALDAAGNHTGNVTGVVPGADPAVAEQEPLFGQDLNGDGMIGPKVTQIEAFGATRLVQLGNRYALRDAEDAGPLLSYGGSPVTAGQFPGAEPIGAEAVAGGWRVAWKVVATDQYVVWAVDAQGNYTAGATGVVPGAAPALVAQEPVLCQDLNGDGRIGAPDAPLASLPAALAANEAQVLLTLPVTLDRAPDGPASLRWRIVPGTAPGAATVAARDMPPGQGGQLSFAPGTAAGWIALRVNDEAHKPEGPESFAVELYDPVGLAIGTARTQVALADHHVPPPPVPLAMLRGGAATQPGLAPYAGPVSYLDQMFILDGNDDVVLSATAPNVFLRTGAGDDALQVAAGQNVVDAGAGSNFITGGSGADVIFLDARGATQPIWSTVVGFAAGDAVTIWGLADTGANLDFQPGGGAPGFTGLTLHTGLPGGPAVVLTLAGYAPGDPVGHIFGTDPTSGSPYLYLWV